MTEQKMFILRFWEPPESFLYWSAKIKAILKTKRVWHEVWADDVASSASSRQVRANDEGSNVSSQHEYGKHAAWSTILQGVSEVQLAGVIQYQEDPLQMWTFLHEL